MARGGSATATTRKKPTYLRRAEVAELAGVSVKAVDKAIEQKALRVKRGPNRAALLEPASVVCMALIKQTGNRLAVSDRRRICRFAYETESSELPKAELELSPGLVVRYSAARDEHAQALGYVRNRARFIESNPKIRHGDPVISGTRIGVHAIADRINDGDSLESVLEDYPHVPREAFETALLYAKANPRRGRPALAWRRPVHA